MPEISAAHRRILDVGCGAGQTLMASNIAKTVLAVGVDVDHAALVYGRQQKSRIRFLRARGEALPFTNGSFDLVICRVALPYMHVHSAIGEMARVLSEGGELWLVLHPLSMTVKELAGSLGQLNLKTAVYRLWVLANGLTLHLIGKQGSWPLQPGRYESWQTFARTKRTLLKVGFTEINVRSGDHFVVTARKPHA